MAQSTQAEPVLARAIELYEEGLAFEQAHEPERAIDRYRRATRMADERDILNRIQQRADVPALGGGQFATPSTAEDGPLPRPDHVSNNEDFELWRALHVSRLEAEVEAGTQAVEFVTGEFNQVFSNTLEPPSAASGVTSLSLTVSSETLAANTYDPPPRRPAAHSLLQGKSEVDEDCEIADHIALRQLRARLGECEHVEAELCAKSTNAHAVAHLDGRDEENSLAVLLREEVPDVFWWLDPYALDRVARTCAALLSMSRSTSAWRELARRCIPKAEHASMVMSLGPGPDVGHYWRNQVLSSPRLRVDGVYIATCGYSRRIAEGASLTDSRQFMNVRYYRLLRFLPPCGGGVDNDGAFVRRVLILKYEGDEVTRAVEAMKTHPSSQNIVNIVQESIPSVVRKLHEKVVLGTYELNREAMLAMVHHVGNAGENVMEFKLRHGRSDGSRQNCRLLWCRYDHISHHDQDVFSYNLQREQHYAPFTFARVVALESLL